MVMLVVDSAVQLVLQHAVAQLNQSAEGRLPAQLHHAAAAAYPVTEHPLIPNPVADDAPVAGESIEVDGMDVPLVLPLCGFQGEIEMAPQAGKMDSSGQCG